MTLPLRARLFILHALVVADALGIVTALALRQSREWLIARHAQSLEAAAARVAATLPRGPAALAGGWPALADSLGRLLGARVTLIDSAGRVLGDSEVPRERLSAVENHAGRPEVRAALAGRTGRAVRRSRTINVELLYVAVPAPRDRGLAVVRLAEPRAVIADLSASLLRLAFAAAGLALLLSIPLVLWVTGRHAARLLELERVSMRLAAGEGQDRAPERPADEIGRLGRAINAMASERRARLAALERERDERERILGHMSDGVALVDGTGRVLRMNRSLAALLDQPLPAPVGTPLAEYARWPELDELLRATGEQGRTLESELRRWGAGPRRVRAAATPLGGPPPDAVLLVLHDLTEAEALNRVRQDFVANAAHELRTPLTSLRGYAETLLDGGLEDAEHREGFVRIIRDQAVRLEALVGDLLALSELEQPGARLRLEPVDLRELAEKAAAGFRARAEQARLSLRVQPGTAAPATGDRGRIEQVLANLIDNALKYTEKGGVTISVGTAEEGAWCEVADTGPGIHEWDQPRIFERFYRADKARSREKGGTGLGLSIVKHIVALHGGQVAVRSRPGEGSVFRFEIPL